MKTASVITASSGVSSRTGDPFVRIDWGELAGQLTPSEAIDFAMSIVTAANGAESDAALVRALGQPIDDPVIASLMLAMRKVRGARNTSGTARARLEDPE